MRKIDPFVRFAAQVSYTPHEEYAVAPDKRLFIFLNDNGYIDVGGDRVKTENGLAVYIPAGVPYRFIGEGALTFIAVNFDLTHYRCEHTAPFGRRLTPSSEYDKGFDPEYTEELSSPFSVGLSGAVEQGRLLTDEYFSKKPYFSEKLSAILKGLLFEMLREKENRPFSDVDKRLKSAVGFIEQNYSDDIKSTDIAAAAGYHPYHLSKLFIKHLGVSPHAYLNRVRLSCAERLLISTDLPITAVSAESGFNSTVSFTKNFKEKHGITPTAYRSRYTKTI